MLLSAIEETIVSRLLCLSGCVVVQRRGIGMLQRDVLFGVARPKSDGLERLSVQSGVNGCLVAKREVA